MKQLYYWDMFKYQWWEIIKHLNNSKFLILKSFRSVDTKSPCTSHRRSTMNQMSARTRLTPSNLSWDTVSVSSSSRDHWHRHADHTHWITSVRGHQVIPQYYTAFLYQPSPATTQGANQCQQYGQILTF